jgi:hypothetical protein
VFVIRENKPDLVTITDSKGNRLAVILRKGETGAFEEKDAPFKMRASGLMAGQKISSLEFPLQHVLIADSGKIEIAIAGEKIVLNHSDMAVVYDAYEITALDNSFVTSIEATNKNIDLEAKTLAEVLNLKVMCVL